MGDSNLARLPSFHLLQGQVDSFPGAKSDHLTHLFSKLSPRLSVHKVILSIGLNNILAQQKLLTIEKFFRSLHKKASLTFPSAEIFFPAIQVLSRSATATLGLTESVNAFLRASYRTLEGVSPDSFHTEPDLVQWTPATARSLF